jgi:hypothetical protein
LEARQTGVDGTASHRSQLAYVGLSIRFRTVHPFMSQCAHLNLTALVFSSFQASMMLLSQPVSMTKE